MLILISVVSIYLSSCALVNNNCLFINATLIFSRSLQPLLSHTDRPYWRCYYSNTDAVIFVVDSSDHDRISISKTELVSMLEVWSYALFVCWLFCLGIFALHVVLARAFHTLPSLWCCLLAVHICSSLTVLKPLFAAFSPHSTSVPKSAFDWFHFSFSFAKEEELKSAVLLVFANKQVCMTSALQLIFLLRINVLLFMNML